MYLYVYIYICVYTHTHTFKPVASEPDDFTDKSYQNNKEETTPFLYNVFQRTRTLFSSLCEVNIILMPKPEILQERKTKEQYIS